MGEHRPEVVLTIGTKGTTDSVRKGAFLPAQMSQVRFLLHTLWIKSSNLSCS
jgi:hypothetical protein